MVAEELGSDFASEETTHTNNYSCSNSFGCNVSLRNGTHPNNGTNRLQPLLDGKDYVKDNGILNKNNNYQNGIHKKEKCAKTTLTETNIDQDKRISEKHARRRILQDKVFVERASLMTEMLQVKEYQGLYNIFVAITINLLLYILLSDLFETGTIDLGVSNVMSQFGKPLNVLALLALMHLSSIVIYYPLFQQWSTKRPPKNALKFFWDLTFAIVGVIFLGFFFYIPIKVNWADPLPASSAAIVVIEQLRLIMKMYSFLRVNVPRARYFHNVNYENREGITLTTQEADEKGEIVGNQNSLIASHDKHSHHLRNTSPISDSSLQLQPPLELRGRNGKIHSTERTASNGILLNGNAHVNEVKGKAIMESYPELSKYVYFLYAPTFIYRDSYPRTKTIRWNFVIKNIGELLGCILLYNLVHRICGFVLFQDFGLPGYSFTAKQLISLIFTQMIPGGVGFVVGFFILLHTSQNIFAEMLRFGDRMFYKDWWNSDSFSEFYRLWNIPVHDFLYTYIYKESKDRGMGSRFKAAPNLMVFTISSLFHEYVLIYVLRFFYPVLLVMFGGFGAILAFMPNRHSRTVGNIFFWWSLITGKGLILAFYILEYYARVNNCPAAESQFVDFILPRSWTCGAITLN